MTSSPQKYKYILFCDKRMLGINHPGRYSFEIHTFSSLNEYQLEKAKEYRFIGDYKEKYGDGAEASRYIIFDNNKCNTLQEIFEKSSNDTYMFIVFHDNQIIGLFHSLRYTFNKHEFKTIEEYQLELARQYEYVTEYQATYAKGNKNATQFIIFDHDKCILLKKHLLQDS